MLLIFKYSLKFILNVDLLKNKTMHAQVITYQLKDISQAEYLKQMVEPDAP